jgi:hypothetical protein
MAIKRDDILEALGIESGPKWLPIALAGFGVGAVVGAAVAILLAPKSGRELRSDLVEKGRDLMGRAKEAGRTEPPQTPAY